MSSDKVVVPTEGILGIFVTEKNCACQIKGLHVIKLICIIEFVLN